MKKLFTIILLILITIFGIINLQSEVIYGVQSLSNPRVGNMIVPTEEEYMFKDYKTTTIDYLNYVLNDNNTYKASNGDYGENGDYRERKIGRYSPNSNIDKIFGETGNLGFGIPSYIGHQINDTELAEGITMLSAIASGSLVGLDMTNYDAGATVGAFNYVKAATQFFQVDGEEVFLNGAGSGQTGKTWWYELLPGVLFSLLASKNPTEEYYTYDLVTKSARSWYKVVVGLGGAAADFNHLSFNIAMNQVVDGSWREPDAAAGMAYILYSAYSFNKQVGAGVYATEAEIEQFRIASIWCMNYLDSLNYSPFYEVLCFLSPYLAARLNAEQHTNYNVYKMYSWTLDGSSAVRSGWGMIDNNWGNKYTKGLMGSLTDGAGYAFTMNTFDAMLGFAPMVKYDARFASDIAKWALSASLSASNFYPEAYTNEGTVNSYNGKNVFNGKNQSGMWINQNDPKASFIAYEGLRRYQKSVVYSSSGARGTQTNNSISPYASGDSYTYNWGGHTDYGLYGSSHVGFFGSTIRSTNVKRILDIDLDALDVYNNSNGIPFRMLYNPYNTVKNITITVNNSNSKFFDTVTNTQINVTKLGSNQITISLQKDQVVVLAEIPENDTITNNLGIFKVNDTFISSTRGTLTMEVRASSNQLINNGDSVVGNIYAKLNISVDDIANIDSIVLYSADTILYSSATIPASTILIDTTLLKNGNNVLKAKLKLKSGVEERSELNIRVLNITKESALVYDDLDDMVNKWTISTNSIREAYPSADHNGSVASSNNGLKIGINPGYAFGFASSEYFYIDFSREPMLELSVSEVSNLYAIKIYVDNDPNLTGQYFIRDTQETGSFTFNILEVLQTENPAFKPEGAFKAAIKVCPVGSSTDYVIIDSIEVYHMYQTPNLTEPSQYNWGFYFSSIWMSFFNKSTENGGLNNPDFEYTREGDILIDGNSLDSGIASPYVVCDTSQNPVFVINPVTLTGNYFLGIRIQGDDNLYVLEDNLSTSSSKEIEIISILKDKFPSLVITPTMQIKIIIGVKPNSTLLVDSIETFYKLPEWGVSIVGQGFEDFTSELLTGAIGEITLDSSLRGVVKNTAPKSNQTVIAGVSTKFSLNFDYNPVFSIIVRDTTFRYRITFNVIGTSKIYILKDWSSDFSKNPININLNSQTGSVLKGKQSIYVNIEVLGGGNTVTIEKISTNYLSIVPEFLNTYTKEIATWVDLTNPCNVSIDSKGAVEIDYKKEGTLPLITPYFTILESYYPIIKIKIDSISDTTSLLFQMIYDGVTYNISTDVTTTGIASFDLYKITNLTNEETKQVRFILGGQGAAYNLKIASIEFGYRLSNIENVNLDNTLNQLTFNEVPNSSVYNYEITDLENNLKSSGQTHTNIISLSELNLPSGAYIIYIKAEASQYYSSIETRYIFKQGDFESILFSPVTDLNIVGNKIKFQEVVNCSTYEYSIYDHDTNALIYKGTTSINEIDISQYIGLAYNFRVEVKPLGDGIVYLTGESQSINYYTYSAAYFNANSFTTMSSNTNNAFATLIAQEAVIQVPQNGNWGSVVSNSFSLNFSNNPILYINFSSLSVGGYYLQIKIDGTTYYLADNTFDIKKVYLDINEILSTRVDGPSTGFTGIHQVSIVYGATMGDFSGTPLIHISESYVFEMTIGTGTPMKGTLESPTLTINGKIVSWNVVPNAESYTIIIKNEFGNLVNQIVSTTNFDFSFLKVVGSYTINVTATGNLYYNSETSIIEFTIVEEKEEEVKKKGCKKTIDFASLILIPVLLIPIFKKRKKEFYE